MIIDRSSNIPARRF